MRNEEALDRAVEDDDLHVGIGFECGDDRVQLGHGFRPEDVQGRIVESDTPKRRRMPFKVDLLVGGHVCLRWRICRVSPARTK